MIIDVPFTSRVSVILPRKRVSQLVWVNDTQAFDIREIAPSSFPLAAMYRGRFNEDYRDNTKPEPIHSDGKRFFRRALVPDFAALVAGVGDEVGNTPFSNDQYLIVGLREGVPRAGLEGRIVEDPRPQRVAALAAAAAKTVLCGGEVFVACGEPCFRWVRGAFAIEPMLFDPRQFQEDPSSYCRADRMHELVPLGLGDEPGPEILGSLEILRPDLLRLSLAAPALVDIAAKAMESLGLEISRGMMSATRADFDAYVTLRDCLMLTPEGEPTVDIKEIARDGVSPDLAAAVSEILTVHPQRMGGRLATAYSRWLAEAMPGACPDTSSGPSGGVR